MPRPRRLRDVCEPAAGLRLPRVTISDFFVFSAISISSGFQLVADQVLHLVDHAADAVVVFMGDFPANAAETQSFDDLPDLLWLANEAAVLPHDDTCHVHPLF